MPEGDVQRRTGEVGGRPGLIPSSTNAAASSSAASRSASWTAVASMSPKSSGPRPAARAARSLASRAVSGPWFAATSVGLGREQSDERSGRAVGQGTPVALDPLRRAKRPRESLDPLLRVAVGDSVGVLGVVRIVGISETAGVGREGHHVPQGHVPLPECGAASPRAARRRGRRRPREDPPPRRRRARTRGRTRPRRPRSSLGSPGRRSPGEIFIVPIIPDARPHQRDEQEETAELGVRPGARRHPRDAALEGATDPRLPVRGQFEPLAGADRPAEERLEPQVVEVDAGRRCRASGSRPPPAGARGWRRRRGPSHGCASGRDASLSSGSSPPATPIPRVGDPGERRGRSLGRPTLTASAPYAAYSATVSAPHAVVSDHGEIVAGRTCLVCRPTGGQFVDDPPSPSRRRGASRRPRRRPRP